MKFKTVYKKKDKILIKFTHPDKGDIWATTTQAVYNWAKKNFKDGDEIIAEYTTKNGEYFVSRISALGKEGSKGIPSVNEYACEDCGASLKDKKYKKCYTCNKSGGKETKKRFTFTCKDCGKELKDDKFKKCYTCNEKNPEPKSGNGRPDYKNGAPYGSLLPIEETRRNKLATLSSVCEAIGVMTGQVNDVEVLGEHIIVLYKKLYKELFG